MELTEIKAVEREVEILAPRTGKPTGLVFVVNSVQCDAVQQVVRDRNDALINRRKIDDADYQLNLLLAAIVGWQWNGDATFEGSKPDFTPQNVRKVLESNAGKSFIRRQISDVISDTDRFFTI